MYRREFLTTAGVGIASSLAGCSSRSGGRQTGGDGGSAPFEHPGTLDAAFATNGDYPRDDRPADGSPPAFPNPPARPEVDESSFGTVDANGETVRLAPIDVVVDWYRRAAIRVVDARGLAQYERSHVYGSVLSTARKGSTGGGIDGWPDDDRIVTYCGCPHHLSSIRAAGLQKAGYTDVYALDEGFGEWSARGYPMAGRRFTPDPRRAVSEWTVSGAVDDRHAGEYAWAAAGRQYEAAPIRADGRFTLRLAFAGVTGETPVRVSTPAFTVTGPLESLASGSVEG